MYHPSYFYQVILNQLHEPLNRVSRHRCWRRLKVNVRAWLLLQDKPLSKVPPIPSRFRPLNEAEAVPELALKSFLVRAFRCILAQCWMFFKGTEISILQFSAIGCNIVRGCRFRFVIELLPSIPFAFILRPSLLLTPFRQMNLHRILHR